MTTTTARVWSSQQTAIFNWFETREGGNLIVRARAGTGKTTTIVEGVLRAPESAILLCAFNKRIKEELAGRILANPRASASTLHALGFKCVLDFWTGIRVGRVGNGPERADALTEDICGATAPDTIKKLVTKLHTLGREINPHARTVGDLTDILYNFECNPEESWESAGFGVRYIEESALKAMELAATVRPTRTGIDFADMIYLPVRNKWVRPAYDLVVVDEAQDMTVAQLEIARGACKGRLAIVGDDRQAIYGFRGADSGSLDRLKKELQATELGLTVTYRCGRTIVEKAQGLVPDFQAGPNNPAGSITTLPADKLTATAEPGDFILSRLNAPLVATAMSLLRSGKRARVAGRDIGGGLKALIRKFKAASVPQLLSKIDAWMTKETARLRAANRPESAIEAIVDRAETLTALALDARSVADIEDRIDALFTDDGLGQAGVITCSTVHRAKGLEADRVFVLFFTLYPRGNREDREEQNIEYVAITRAKNHLVVVTKPAVV